MTNLGNENGYWVIYKSDRYGFNNPDKLWDKDNIELATKSWFKFMSNNK